MTNHLARMLNIRPESGGAIMVHTHYLPAFAKPHPSDPHFAAAVCDRYITPSQHSDQPTCPDCQTALQESDIHEGYISEHDERVEEDEPLPGRWA
jgi:hypothetical protein